MSTIQQNTEIKIKVENVKEEVKDEFTNATGSIMETKSPSLDALSQGQHVIQIQNGNITLPPLELNADGILKINSNLTPDAAYWAQFMAQYDNDLNTLKQMIPLDMIKEEDISINNNDITDPTSNLKVTGPSHNNNNGIPIANINKQFVTTFFDNLQNVSPHLPKKFKDVVYCEHCKESRVRIATLEGKNIQLETKMFEMNQLCNDLRAECNEKVQVALKEVNNAFQFESSLQIERRERLGEISQLKAVIDSLQNDNANLRNHLNELNNNNTEKQQEAEKNIAKAESDSEVYQKMYEKISKNVNQKLHEVWQKKSAEISELKLVNERLSKENSILFQGKQTGDIAAGERKILEDRIKSGLKTKTANRLHLIALKEKCNMQTDRFRLLKQAVMKQHLEINTLKEVMGKQETECKKLEEGNTEMNTQVEKMKKTNETIVQQHKKALALLKQKNETILELQTTKHVETMKKGQDLESIFDEIDVELRTLNKNKSKLVQEEDKPLLKIPTDKQLAMELLKGRKIKIEKEDMDDFQDSEQETEEEAKCRYCPKTFSGDDCYIKQLNHEKAHHSASSSSNASDVEKTLHQHKKIGDQIQVEVVRK